MWMGMKNRIGHSGLSREVILVSWRLLRSDHHIVLVHDVEGGRRAGRR